LARRANGALAQHREGWKKARDPEGAPPGQPLLSGWRFVFFTGRGRGGRPATRALLGDRLRSGGGSHGGPRHPTTIPSSHGPSWGKPRGTGHCPAAHPKAAQTSGPPGGRGGGGCNQAFGPEFPGGGAGGASFQGSGRPPWGGDRLEKICAGVHRGPPKKTFTAPGHFFGPTARTPQTEPPPSTTEGFSTRTATAGGKWASVDERERTPKPVGGGLILMLTGRLGGGLPKAGRGGARYFRARGGRSEGGNGARVVRRRACSNQDGPRGSPGERTRRSAPGRARVGKKPKGTEGRAGGAVVRRGRTPTRAAASGSPTSGLGVAPLRVF